MVDSVLRQVAREYDLGEPLEQEALSGGSAPVFRLRTSRHMVIIKHGADERELCLYKRVAETLNVRGVRQARLYSTVSDRLQSSSGHAVFEHLPGTWAWQPTSTQAAVFMRYFAAYNRALCEIPIPPFVTTVDTPWKKADSLDYLLHDLRGDLAQIQLSPLFARTADRALTFLARHRSPLDAMPKQLVHGDVGPGNILYTDGGGEPSAVLVDFTPYRESALYSLCVSFYWHYVYGNHGRPNIARIGDDLCVYAAVYPFSAEEKRAFYATFVKVAARILFVPLLLNLAADRPELDAASDSRATAMNNILDSRRDLETAILRVG